MANPRVWLVTGASSGFGKYVTECVLAKGDIVIATLRRPEALQDLSVKYSEDKLLVLKVDVTNQMDINHAFACTKDTFGRLDVVFNNAGSSVLGDAETTPIDTARALFEVNFWGAVQVSRAAIKFFREVNEPGRGGVLLQNSSSSAVVGVPGLPFYSASKQALSAFSESLATEVLPQWNIKICIIQPGGFETGIMANTTYLPENSLYKTSAITAFWGPVTAPGFKWPGDPAKFAKAIYSLVEGGNFPLHLPMGRDALQVVQKQVESLGKEIAEVAPWSADLLRDDITS